MSEAEFNNGYWYAYEIKAFAKKLGIPHSSKLRKDELENLIKYYLRTGKVGISDRKNIQKKGTKDIELGLHLDLVIKHYTSNKTTKEFIEKEALKINPQLKRKSGARYRLNRWRDDQITKENKITYRDLVEQYVYLNERTDSFEKIPHGRYINFVADFLKYEQDSDRSQAIAAWNKLKKMQIPKEYSAWRIKNKK